jgi:hypothetical protein
MGWSSRANRVVACAIPDAPADQAASGQGDGHNGAAALPRAVLRSIEPVIAIPAAAVEIPVVFPGYVLPDDTFEDTAHAGS